MKRPNVPPLMEIQKLMASLYEEDDLVLPPGRIALAGALLLARDPAVRFDVALTDKDCDFLRSLRIGVQG